MPNTTTLKAIRREMLAKNQALGLKFNIASLTTTTAVVTLLAAGGFTQGRFFGRFLVRADAASAADRIRRVTDFTASSGTLTHAGTNYADTTATSEILEILEYEPWIYDEAINLTLNRLKRRDRTIIPCIPGTSWYDLGDLNWIEEPSDIMEVRWSPSPVLSNNGDFTKWNSYNTSGVLTPDNWTVGGASATAARSTTQVYSGSYSAQLVRAGTNATLTQTIGLLRNGVESLASDVVTISSMIWSDTASKARISISDGVTTTNSSFHTGGSTWEELSSEVTIGATATTLTIAAQVNVDAGTAYFDKTMLNYAALNDAIRRGNHAEYTIPLEDSDFDQYAGSLKIKLPVHGYSSHFIIYSKRPYPQLDATRFLAGSADADVIDAPVDLVAIGAISRLYFTLAQRETDNERKQQYATHYRKWEGNFNRLAREHLGVKAQNSGFQFNRPWSLLPPARSF